MTVFWTVIIGLLAFAYTLEPLFRRQVAVTVGKAARARAAQTVLDTNLEEAQLDVALGKLTPEEYENYAKEKATERASLDDALEREIQKLRRKKRQR